MIQYSGNRIWRALLSFARPLTSIVCHYNHRLSRRTPPPYSVMDRCGWTDGPLPNKCFSCGKQITIPIQCVSRKFNFVPIDLLNMQTRFVLENFVVFWHFYQTSVVVLRYFKNRSITGFYSVYHTIRSPGERAGVVRLKQSSSPINRRRLFRIHQLLFIFLFHQDPLDICSTVNLDPIRSSWMVRYATVQACCHQ